MIDYPDKNSEPKHNAATLQSQGVLLYTYVRSPSLASPVKLYLSTFRMAIAPLKQEQSAQAHNVYISILRNCLTYFLSPALNFNETGGTTCEKLP